MKISRPQPAGDRRPLVTVVVPCYNYGRYLPDAVQSITSQEGVDVEVIIVDDASTDGSQQVAQDLAAADDRIRLILHEQNKRHIATYNDGLREATGDYVVLLSADDLLAPGALSRSSNLMERYPEVGMVYGYAADFEGDVPAERQDSETWSLWTGPQWIAKISRRGRNMMFSPEVTLRRSVLAQLEGYDRDMPHSADMDMWMRAAALGGVGRINGPDQAYYRVHAANMHLTDYAGLIADAAARRLTYDRFFAGSGATLPNARRLQAAAHAALARELMRAACVALDQGDEIAGAGSAQIVELARDIWPAIEKDRLWRRYQRRLRHPAGRARRFIESRVEYRGPLRQSLWRRYGL